MGPIFNPLLPSNYKVWEIRQDFIIKDFQFIPFCFVLLRLDRYPFPWTGEEILNYKVKPDFLGFFFFFFSTSFKNYCQGFS